MQFAATVYSAAGVPGWRNRYYKSYRIEEGATVNTYYHQIDYTRYVIIAPRDFSGVARKTNPFNNVPHWARRKKCRTSHPFERIIRTLTYNIERMGSICQPVWRTLVCWSISYDAAAINLRSFYTLHSFYPDSVVFYLKVEDWKKTGYESTKKRITRSYVRVV